MNIGRLGGIARKDATARPRLQADYVMAMVGELTKEKPPPTVASTRRRGQTASRAMAVAGE